MGKEVHSKVTHHNSVNVSGFIMEAGWQRDEGGRPRDQGGQEVPVPVQIQEDQGRPRSAPTGSSSPPSLPTAPTSRPRSPRSGRASHIVPVLLLFNLFVLLLFNFSKFFCGNKSAEIFIGYFEVFFHLVRHWATLSTYSLIVCGIVRQCISLHLVVALPCFLF